MTDQPSPAFRAEIAMQPVERYEHAGVQVSIFYDEDDFNPRDADNLGEIYVSYPGHNLGDHQLPSSGFPDLRCPSCDGAAETSAEVCSRCEGRGEISPTLGEWLTSLLALAAMPLFVYDHGIITIRGGRLVMLEEDRVSPQDTVSVNRFAGDAQGWDTSFVGFMIVTEERINELCGDGPEHRRQEWLEAALKSELTEYDRFLRGEVYSYRVAEGTPFEDSCGGFIGLQYAKEEAERAAELAAAQQQDEQVARAGSRRDHRHRRLKSPHQFRRGSQIHITLAKETLMPETSHQPLAVPICAACGRSSRPGAALCTRCARRLFSAKPTLSNSPAGCDRAWSSAPYEGVARDLVAALKFRHLRPVADLMAERIEWLAPAHTLSGTIVPVPSGRKRRSRSTALEPSIEIAEALTERLDSRLAGCLELHPDDRSLSCRRKRPSRIAHPPTIRATGTAPRSALLITDLLDDGSVLTACARALRAAGSSRVVAITFARRI